MLFGVVLGASYFNQSHYDIVIRIVSMLPHHLFFCNDPSEVTDMKQSFDVLQTCWVNHYIVYILHYR